MPLDEAGAEADDEEEADDDALAFVSEPDDEDDVESDDFEDVDAGVLLDEEPRLSFR
ncbi:DNA primase [Streptomyces griseus subsp. griseus]|nr:DNA primase [Streptomyces griseus subsp. griseus]